MPKCLYRDQVERFYELERLEYSLIDIASLCAMSVGGVRLWRKTPPVPADFIERPVHGLGLPPMRPKRPAPATAKPSLTRVTPPPEVAAAQAAPTEPEQKRIGRPPEPRLIVPGLTTTEKMPPGGKKEAARLGALRPVTEGRLERTVAKQLAKQKAELLAEIKAAQGFDPAVTWSSDVDHLGFDPIRALVQLAHVPDCPHNTILGILRTLVTLRKERAKIAWEGVSLEDIPVEHRQRLAGLLAEFLELSDLPAEVQEHEAVREVYELTAVALPQPEAEAFLLRWESALESMREDAEARIPGLRSQDKLVMTGPPKVAAEFRVKPATGSRP